MRKIQAGSLTNLVTMASLMFWNPTTAPTAKTLHYGVTIPRNACGEAAAWMVHRRGSRMSELTSTTSPEAFADPAALDKQHDFFVGFLDTVNALPAAQANHQRVIEILAPHENRSFLDVGCGTGAFARALALLVGVGGRVVGLDQSERFLAVAAARSVGMSPPLDFVTGDANALPFADATFDGCRTERVLQYLADPGHGIAEMMRVTKPGGRIVATEVDWDTVVRDLPGVDRELQRRLLLAINEHVGEAWMGRQLRRHFLEAGLSDVTCEGVVLIFTDPASPRHLGFTELIARARRQGSITPDEATTLLAATAASCAKDQYFLSLTLYTTSGRVVA
jgi:ubiquinone/menaquinone biosynthesis C-methylase UbiE